MITFDAAEHGWMKLDTEKALEWEFPYTDGEGRYIQSLLNKPNQYPCLYKPFTFIANVDYGFNVVADYIYDFTGDCDPAWQSSSYNC